MKLFVEHIMLKFPEEVDAIKSYARRLWGVRYYYRSKCLVSGRTMYSLMYTRSEVSMLTPFTHTSAQSINSIIL